MKKPSIKTDNTYLGEKVILRLNHLPPGDLVRVLDAYHGEGLIWDAVRAQSERKVEVLGIDTRDTEGVVQLQGDNKKFLGEIDLSSYNVLDLDAYGVPYQALSQALSNRTLAPGTAIFLTFIQSQHGRLPPAMLQEIGYTREMIKKIPTIFNRAGFQKFKLWLATQGIGIIHYITRANKNYLYLEAPANVAHTTKSS